MSPQTKQNEADGLIIDIRTEHGEQHGAPDVQVFVVKLADGQMIERSYSITYGENGILASGRIERNL